MTTIVPTESTRGSHSLAQRFEEFNADHDGERRHYAAVPTVWQRHSGEYGRAAALYVEGLTLSRQTGAINNSMLFLHNLGLVALYQGDVSRATACYAECLALTKKVGHRLITVGCLEGFARAAAALGDHRRAARIPRRQGH